MPPGEAPTAWTISAPYPGVGLPSVRLTPNWSTSSRSRASEADINEIRMPLREWLIREQD
jgi:hypothetical protein